MLGFASIVACLAWRERNIMFERYGNDVMSAKFCEPDPNDNRIADDTCIICFEPLSKQYLAQCVTCGHITHSECLHDHLLYSARGGRLGKCIMGCE